MLMIPFIPLHIARRVYRTARLVYCNYCHLYKLTIISISIIVVVVVTVVIFRRVYMRWLLLIKLLGISTHCKSRWWNIRFNKSH